MPDSHEPHGDPAPEGAPPKPKTISVSASELEDMAQSVDNAAMYVMAFISRETGKIYLQTDYVDPNEPLPDDLDDPDLYIVVPDKRQLDLGRRLVLRFAETELPEDHDDVLDMFRQKGAYRRFRDLLQRRGAVDRWHAFENAATGAALRDWCDDNRIELIEDRRTAR